MRKGISMKKKCLKIYDKLIISIIISIFALAGCGTKKKVTDNDRKSKTETKQNKTDSIQKANEINKEPVIALYGVRPNQLK